MSSGGGNGQLSLVPPGFRFHPTDEELLYYYLRKKVSYEAVDLDVIREVDLNKLEPWDLKDKCRIGSGIENEWYFFSHKDKKYPTGTRTNRATIAGFWKATGRDKAIYLSNANSKKIGMRKTLVFYTGRAPHGQKTDWIMHEYRLEDNIDDHYSNNNNNVANQVQEEGWVVCRVFRKKLCHGNGGDNLISNPGFFQLEHQPQTTRFDDDHEKQAQVLLAGAQFSNNNNLSPYMKLPSTVPTVPKFTADPTLQNLMTLHESSACMHLPQLWSPESTTVPSTSSHHHLHQNNYFSRPMLTNTTTTATTAANTNFSYNVNRDCGGGGDWSFLDKLLQASHAQSLRSEDNIITRFNYPNSLSLANDVSASATTPLTHGSYTRFGASAPNLMF